MILGQFSPRQVESPNDAGGTSRAERASPSDAEAHAYGIETTRMSGVGHLLMLEDLAGFSRLLEQAGSTQPRPLLPENGTQLEDVQRAAKHRDPRTSKLYDRGHKQKKQRGSLRRND